jgi:osmoprotectant transport system ATP-binding protein
VPDQTAAASIRLEDLTKVYPGSDIPAVDRVNMTIPAGEIVVLVGPSGCGKTTTMRMINRLIEPTSGRIFLDDEDITHGDVNVLRRRIGYAIQKTGLFPHETIYDNVATVPRLVGWKSDRVDARVKSLLDLVGLDPSIFADRFPKELSGGQQQRVGVARAMAADPPVMLMDEPFGATDPITRERLQNEFLRIQAEIGKTIVFVTHDIDEAIKMGDRIAILKERSEIAQFDTPENILSNPASQFVSDFIGAGRSLKRLNLTRVRDVETHDMPTVTADKSVTAMRNQLSALDRTSLLLLDDEGKPEKWLTSRDLDRITGDVQLADVGMPVVALVEPQATLSDALDEMLTSNGGVAVVVDGRGRYEGTVDMETAIDTIRTLRDASEADLRAARDSSRAAQIAAGSGERA